MTPNVASAADLRGLTAGIQSGNTSDFVARKFLARGDIAGIRYYPYHGIATAIDDLEAGRIGLIIKLFPVISWLIKGKADLAVVMQEPTHEHLGIAFAPNRADLCDAVDAAIDELRASGEVRRFHANFSYQAGSWIKPRRVIAKVEWHPGELYPRVGFIVTNMSRPAERVVAFYNKRGTCEQWIKEGKGAIKWTRLSCRTFAANAVRLQLHALAYNLGNFLRTLATPEPIKDWSLTSLKEKLIKIGAKVVSHGRYIAFQMAEVAIPRQMFQEILRLIAELRPQPPPAPA